MTMFKRSLSVLEELEEKLKCYICKKIVNNAVVKESCDHFFCRDCATSNCNNHCPKCGISSFSTELYNYEIINATVAHYVKIKDLLTQSHTVHTDIENIADDSTYEIVKHNTSDNSIKKVLSENKSANLSTPKHSNDKKAFKMIHRRNVRGETSLQVACIKGDIEEVTRLIQLGANPNTKDNAGWTPLHEACNKGHNDIAQLLLDNGANVNALGVDSITPLHEAVMNQSLDLVKILLRHGADKSIKTKEGRTPLDFVKDKELENILHSETLKLVTCTSIIEPKVTSLAQIVLCSTGLNECHKIQYEKCVKLLKAKTTNMFTEEVTHLIAADGGQRKCPRTLKYLHAVLKGVWILSTDWLDACVYKGQIVEETSYEINGTIPFPDCNGAKRGRENSQNNKPGLFHGFKFYFHGKFTHPSPPKNELINLAKLAGGIVLEEMPISEADVPLATPCHLKPNSKLNGYSYFIIYNENQVNSRKTLSVKCSLILSVAWFLNCIAKFEIEEP